MDVDSKNTLKSYEENFLNNSTVRFHTNLNMNHWKNTRSVMEWFKRTEQTHLSCST